ncbi:hypothetical protein SDC9_197487 [bioreactor metagenome]|uniref:Uncharacterized protein n=1 Tax=bioreactor metagenome TaxID=1076179 RepID=A0A645IRG0_9ZZZZ
MKFSYFVNKKNTTVSPGTGAGFGLWDPGGSHGAGSLVYGVMDRSDQRIGNIAFIKPAYGGVNFHKVGVFLKR